MACGHSSSVSGNVRALTLWALAMLCAGVVGCGRMDLGHVRGEVVGNGERRGFQHPEMMNVTFSMDDANIPRGYTTPVKADGTFSVDMNDGTGRGIPEGKYVVAIDVSGLLMKAPGAASKTSQDGGNEYPRPSPDVIRRLKNAKCTIELKRRRNVYLVVDLDNGTIKESARP